MSEPSEELRALLDREVEVHRDLLTIARTRNLLLRRGRHADLDSLRRDEVTKVDELRQLEQLRVRLADAAHDHPASVDIADTTARIAGLLRQLGAVERANRLLFSRAAVRTASLDGGIGVWAGTPTG